MNVTTMHHGNIVGDIRIVKQAGFAGIARRTPKLSRYLDAGFSAAHGIGRGARDDVALCVDT